MLRWFVLLLAMVTLAACDAGSAPPTAQPQGNTNAERVTSLIRWPEDPFHIIFRADVVGGEAALYRLNEVPPCTIYGDLRVVWATEAPGGTQQVLFDVLDRETVNDFVSYLTITERIYTYEAEFGSQIISGQMPVYERLQLNVNDVQHVTDVFGGWGVNYFQRLVQACQMLSDAPTQFEPQGAWLTVQTANYDDNVPSIVWPAGAMGISMAVEAERDGKRWIEGQPVRALWRNLQQNSLDMQIFEGNTVYQFALEVPGVTAAAPPAPLEGDASETPEPEA